MKQQILVPVILLIMAVVNPCPVQGQDSLLTLDQAIELGLENNHGVRISRNLAEISSNNRTLGNAGFLPEISASASRSESVVDSRFETAASSGENRGAESTSTNAGVSLNWTLFDGFQMFAVHERLGELEEMGRTEFRLQMEETVNLIIASYVTIIRISGQLRVFEDAVSVSRERIEIAETKRDLGSGSEYELLQARNDLNTDRAAVLRERNRLEDAKILLNELLGRSPEIDFEVMPDIPLNRTLDYEDLYENVIRQNSELQLARTDLRLANLEIRQIIGERYPELELTSGYNFSRSEGGGGFMQLNESTGFNIGITARVNLFEGRNVDRRIQNARIQARNSEIRIEQEEQRIQSGFVSSWRAYLNTLELVDLEQENLVNAEETLDIALERFRIGTISALEFREAQRVLLSAENRLIEAEYDAKLAETELLRLSGGLQHLAIGR